MNKKISNKLKKSIISAMIFLILTATLFVFTSCKRDDQNTIVGSTDTIASESTADTTIDSGTIAANETTTSEKETSTQTTGSGTETTAATETTTGITNPQAQQIIEVTAKSGGYSPRKIDAKAGVPTILVMKSDGAYGCERAFNIPDLNISQILPENGQTQFDLGTQAKGTKLLGVCSMGMYYFQILFN